VVATPFPADTGDTEVVYSHTGIASSIFNNAGRRQSRRSQSRAP